MLLLTASVTPALARRKVIIIGDAHRFRVRRPADLDPMIRHVLGLALGVTLLAQSTLAQNSASIAGRVVTKASRAAVAGADVELAPGARRHVTDDAGRFKFDQVPTGNVTLIVKRLGFVQESLYVTLGDREDLDVLVELEQAVQHLDTVNVAAREKPLPRGRLSAFYERKRFGIGRFLDSTHFEDVTHRQLADILAARLPGIRKVPLRGGSAVAMATARTSRMATRRRPPPPCFVGVYLDGVVVSGASVFDVNTLNPAHIAAVEFYSGPGQIPAQFNKTGSACGVLLIWSK